MLKFCLNLWRIGVYSTATVFDCRSSAAYSLRPEFAVLKIVRSLASQAEVCAVCGSYAWCGVGHCCLTHGIKGAASLLSQFIDLRGIHLLISTL